jgi:hypothetical protein
LAHRSCSSARGLVPVADCRADTKPMFRCLEIPCSLFSFHTFRAG